MNFPKIKTPPSLVIVTETHKSRGSTLVEEVRDFFRLKKSGNEDEST